MQNEAAVRQIAPAQLWCGFMANRIASPQVADFRNCPADIAGGAIAYFPT